jgi:hypothetical protein
MVSQYMIGETMTWPLFPRCQVNHAVIFSRRLGPRLDVVQARDPDYGKDHDLDDCYPAHG